MTRKEKCHKKKLISGAERGEGVRGGGVGLSCHDFAFHIWQLFIFLFEIGKGR